MAIGIIVVEDDDDLRDSLCRFLGRVGMSARGAACGCDLDALLAEGDAQVVVLDVNLPDETGFAITSRLRSTHPHIGIIMLTAFGSVGDRVLGLTVGADAYLSKPVQLAELQATILSLTRRMAGTAAESGTMHDPAPAIPVSSWSLDRASWTLAADGVSAIPLTGAEFTVLDLVFRTPGTPVSREAIAHALGKGGRDTDDRSIDAVLTRLRRKVEAACGTTLPVKAVRGIGYVCCHRMDGGEN
jgi:DNA-binding response OmpR family regulator